LDKVALKLRWVLIRKRILKKTLALFVELPGDRS
jgi:hypothetical protein